jgi:hypothetical protein
LKPPGWRFPKDKTKDIQKRIRPNSFLEQHERVMERIQRLKPPDWGFPKDKVMDIPIKIRPNPFLEQPERVMGMIQRVETSRLGVSEG